jgi:hypothetical protein
MSWQERRFGGAMDSRLRIAFVLPFVLILSACPGFNRIMTYGTGWADAMYNVHGKRFEVWIHPTDNSILLNSTIGNAFAKGMVKGASLGIAETAPSYSVWMAGAKALLDPVGCTVKDLRPLKQEVSWEFDFVCPPGVDLRRMMREQRTELRDGKPLDLAR